MSVPRVRIDGLSDRGDKDEIRRIYAKFGPLKNVWVADNPPGFAYVFFYDVADAEEAMKHTDGSRLCGRNVQVELKMVEDRRNTRGRGGGPRERGDYYSGGDYRSGGSRGRSGQSYESRGSSNYGGGGRYNDQSRGDYSERKDYSYGGRGRGGGRDYDGGGGRGGRYVGRGGGGYGSGGGGYSSSHSDSQRYGRGRGWRGGYHEQYGRSGGGDYGSDYRQHSDGYRGRGRGRGGYKSYDRKEYSRDGQAEGSSGGSRERYRNTDYEDWSQSKSYGGRGGKRSSDYEYRDQRSREHTGRDEGGQHRHSGDRRAHSPQRDSSSYQDSARKYRRDDDSRKPAQLSSDEYAEDEWQEEYRDRSPQRSARSPAHRARSPQHGSSHHLESPPHRPRYREEDQPRLRGKDGTDYSLQPRSPKSHSSYRQRSFSFSPSPSRSYPVERYNSPGPSSPEQATAAYEHVDQYPVEREEEEAYHSPGARSPHSDYGGGPPAYTSPAEPRRLKYDKEGKQTGAEKSAKRAEREVLVGSERYMKLEERREHRQQFSSPGGSGRRRRSPSPRRKRSPSFSGSPSSPRIHSPLRAD